MVFADDGAASSDVKIKGKEGTYTSLKEAVEKAESGDTILLGEGDYTLYKVDSNGMTKGKDLTFVGKGTDKTTWYIGAYVTDLIRPESILVTTALTVQAPLPSRI